MGEYLRGRRCGYQAVVTATLLAMLAGCGSSVELPAGPVATGELGARRIVIGQITPGTSQIPLFVALERGFFKNAGINVQLQSLSGGTPAAMASFATGEVNMIAGGAFEVIEYVGRGIIAGKIIGELADQNYDIVGGRDIATLAQLQGKAIGISAPNGTDQLYIKAVLKKNGLSDKNVTYITGGGTANRLVALSTGAVQGIAVSNANRSTSAKLGTVLLKSGDSPVAVPGAVLFAANDLIATDKVALSRLLASLGAATEWIRANRAAAAQDCAKGTGSTLEACAEAIEINLDPTQSSVHTWSRTNAVNAVSIASAMNIMRDLVPATDRLTIDALVDSSVALDSR